MPTLIDKSGNLVYFGRLSWGNFFDWLITLCLAFILVVATTSLGGVRPEAHAFLLPCFVLLLVLHGIWYAVEDEVPTRLNQMPLLFVPFLGLVALSAAWISPVGWRGAQLLIYLLEAFIFLWVLSNNARSRAHVWVLLLASTVALGQGVLIGFFQFFQKPDKIVDGMTEYPVLLNTEYLGQATGTFADPHSFALLLLCFLPVFLFAGSVPRLPGIVRVLCHYVALMLLIAVVLTQVLWAYVLLAVMLFLVPWYVYKPVGKRLSAGAGTALIAVLAMAGFFLFNPVIQQHVLTELSLAGEGVRRLLWPESVAALTEQIVLGHGAGSFGWGLEQSDRLSMAGVADSPLNDVLWLCVEFGLLGLLLIVLPVGVILRSGYNRWKAEPFSVRLVLLKKKKVMPPQRFFLSIALLGSVAAMLGAVLHGILAVPALLLNAMFFLGLLLKLGFHRRLVFPDRVWVRVSFLVLTIGLASGFYFMAAPRLAAQAIELQARQDFEELIRLRVHLSGNAQLLDAVIERYEEGVSLDPANADLWIGLSAAHGQLFFRNPSLSYQIGSQSLEYAQRAVQLSPDYWRGWTQAGVAHALMGQDVEAEAALLRGLELAPNSSNAHYYWAAFASHFPDKVEAAKVSAERALEINPDNAAAQRLYQKLQIL